MNNKIYNDFLEEGFLVQQDVIDYLSGFSDPRNKAQEIMKRLANEDGVITLTLVKDLTDHAAEEAQKKELQKSKVGGEEYVEPEGLVNADINIIKDITGCSTCRGTVEDFANYFTSRFEMLKPLLKRDKELKRTVQISRLRKMEGDVSFIGMVTEIRTTKKKKHTIVEIEDRYGKIPVLLSKDKFFEPLLLDEVVGIVGRKQFRKDIVYCNKLIWPPMKKHNPSVSSTPMRVAFVSDMHVGSSTFLEREWVRFVKWLNTAEGKKIGCIVMPGDLVDGIGVYPNQEEELEILDIYDQYSEVARLIEDIPEHIKLVMAPGNHDAVRPAEPQPSLPPEIRELFDREILFVGNPCTLKINGVEILLYHGKSFDDIIPGIPGLSYGNPLQTMKEILKRRHLAPTYGNKTPLAPESVDYMFIDRIPDIFVTGHVHYAALEKYKGITLINASTWEGQTSFQRKMSIDPVPCKVPIVDLATGNATMKDFLNT